MGLPGFADFTFGWGKRYALMVVLSYSRLLWLRFFARKDMRALLASLEEAFGIIGGVPQELLFDQMRSVITRDGRAERRAAGDERGVHPLRGPMGLQGPGVQAPTGRRRRARSSGRCCTSGRTSSTVESSSGTATGRRFERIAACSRRLLRRPELSSPRSRASKSGGEIYGDDVMAAALIDRLLHHWNVVNIRGNSYRMRHPRRTLDYPQLISRRGR